MKNSRFASLALAAFLHVAPFLARTLPALPSLGSSPAGILFKWVLGAVVVGGSMHTVSAATAVLASPSTISGQTGTRLSYQIRITDGKSRLPGSWVINGKTFAKTGSTTNGMPPGLTLGLSTAIISGTPNTAGSYKVPITAYEDANRGGARLTFTLTFNIAGTASPPGISSDPVGGTATEGDPFAFTVVATGDDPLSYQWFHNSEAIAGATDPTLSLNPVALADAGSYTVSVANNAGTVTSTPVTLVVLPAVVPPTITRQPVDVALHTGEPLALTVTANGSGPLHYRWKHEGLDLPAAADAPSLDLPAVTPDDAGSYLVEVTGPGGQTSTTPVRVTVIPLTLGHPASDGSAVRFAFPAIPGRHYVLESTTSLLDPVWNTALEVTATADSVDITQVVSSSPALFWRCLARP